MSRRTASALALAAALVPGCSAPQQQKERPEAVQAPAARPETVKSTQRARRSIDRRWAAIADDVPGFAGLYVRGDTVVVMLVDTARLADAERALRQSPAGFPTGYRHVVARRARYNSRQLYDWRQQALDLMGGGGVVTLGIDEARNRVHLGVLDSSYVAPVRAALTARGVPTGAFILEVTGPRRFLSR
jgi:hypothetical protein